MKATASGPPITARFCHNCAVCGKLVFPGDSVYVMPNKSVYHVACKESKPIKH